MKRRVCFLCYTLRVDDFRKRVLVNAGIIAASFAAFFVIFYILIRLTGNQSAAIEKDRSALAEKSYALDNLSSLKTRGPEADKYMQQIAALLPSGQDGLLSLSQFLDTTSRTHNVSLSFSYSGLAVAPQNGQPGYIPLSITVSGSAQNVRDFINDIESLATKFLINFDSVDMSAGGSGTYGAAISGRVFFE